MARAIIQGFAEQGGYVVTTDGRVSVTKVQRSFPGCTVSVFNAGTATPSTIFSDVGGTPKANPFIASTDGYWFFYADDGSYDVTFSGAGIPTPFSLFNFTIGQSGALNDPGANGLLARTAPNTVTPRTITGVTNETAVTNGNGVSGNPTIGLATFLEFTGKTLNGGTYLSPGIANFGSAQHSHSDAAGGGQMNATNVFSSGTVPVARLPIMVGASGGGNGVAGLVPQPLIADAANFLRGDGVWATAGGGGGGTPGGASTTIQYNNAGAFGGVSGATSDGTNIVFGSTNLRATSPRITTNILDANGNAILTLNAVGTSVNNIQLANAAAGGVPTFTAIGTDTNININVNPKGTGVIMSTGNLTLSNNTPQVTLIDVNDSKQIRLFLSGGTCGIINDTLGQTPVSISTTNNDVAFAGSVTINGANLVIPTGSDTHNIFFGADFRMDGDDTLNRWRFIAIPAAQAAIEISATTAVTTFSQLPVIPTTTPTTSGQVVSKQTLDNALLPFSINFYEYDPSASTTGTDDRPRFIIPSNVVGGTITQAMLSYNSGSAISGGNTIVFQFRKWSAGAANNDWANITMTSSHTPNTTHIFNIADLGLTGSDAITYYISSRSASGINPRGLTISLEGTWKRTNP